MSKTNKTLNKCDELIERLTELKKALMDTNVQSNRKPMNSLGVGWSSDPSTGALHHSTHGIISTFKAPEGHFEIKHGGKVVGMAPTAGEAGKKIKSYVGSLGAGDTGMHNMDPMAQSEDGDVEKSGYGPKKAGLYNAADNAKRKMGNVGTERFGNQSVKSYTHRATAHKEPRGAAGPAKIYTPEQIAAINEANKLKKTAEGSPWVQHGSVPNADVELAKLRKNNPAEKAENIMANQLANMMQGRAMLGTPPPRQPTDQEMFGHLVPSEEEIQKAESGWANKMNWLEEAMKPIAARFDSPEEEQAYWDSIKVADRDDGKTGY